MRPASVPICCLGGHGSAMLGNKTAGRRARRQRNAPMFDEFGPIDTDTHITEPPDVWTSRVSKKWGNAVPHIRRVDGMDMWFVRDQVIHAPGWVTMAGFDGSYPEHPQGFDDIPKSSY